VREPRQDDPGRLLGYATKVESLVGHISPFENPNLGPTQYNCSAANKALDKLGYKRGSAGSASRRPRAARTRSRPTR
jgi:hypothetical protein